MGSKAFLIIPAVLIVFLLTTPAAATHLRDIGSSSYSHSGFDGDSYSESTSYYEKTSRDYDRYGTQRTTTVIRESKTITKKDVDRLYYYPSTFKRSYDKAPTAYVRSPSGNKYYDQYDYAVYPCSYWRYKPVYMYNDYGNDAYGKPYYYEPHHSCYDDYYDWKY